MLERRCVVTCFCNPKKKERTFEKKERLEFFPKKCSFLHVSSLTSSSMKKKEDMQEHDDKEKNTKKERNSPAQVKTLRTRTPFVRSFPALFIHSICHAGGEIQKSICISKTERKQTMKKRAPTLPPTIIDRGLSMIAMRVTFSRACARARKKKVILYARANACKCAREKVKRK